jgi:hypothetical protein
MVHDLEFLIKSALSNVKKGDTLSTKAYYSGLMTGFKIARMFVDLNVMTISNEVWATLNGEIDPIPSIVEFRQNILRGTYGVVDLSKDCFSNPDLRYNKLYSVGLADAVMVALIEVPRLAMITNSDDWQSYVLMWIDLKIEDILFRGWTR